MTAQVASQANSTYQDRSRGAKQVATGLAWIRHATRSRSHASWVEAMGVPRGMSVADVGTGIGYMLPFLSRAVGRGGKVFAEDIFDDFLASAKQRVENQRRQT